MDVRTSKYHSILKSLGVGNAILSSLLISALAGIGEAEEAFASPSEESIDILNSRKEWLISEYTATVPAVKQFYSSLEAVGVARVYRADEHAKESLSFRTEFRIFRRENSLRFEGDSFTADDKFDRAGMELIYDDTYWQLGRDLNSKRYFITSYGKVKNSDSWTALFVDGAYSFQHFDLLDHLFRQSERAL